MDVRWIHSNSTLTFVGSFDGHSFVGHKSIDPTSTDLNQATVLQDGSLEAHFLKKANVIFQKTVEPDHGATGK